MSEFISPKHRKLRSTFESIERQFAQMERLSCEQRALGLAEDLTTQDAVRNPGNTGKYGDEIREIRGQTGRSLVFDIAFSEA
jgi:hypothetical protein